MPDQPAPDFEEARLRAYALREYADRKTGYIFENEVYNLRAAADLIEALLSEREAREEALKLALMHLEDPRAIAAVRAAMLPATEAAQAEQPTSEAGS